MDVLSRLALARLVRAVEAHAAAPLPGGWDDCVAEAFGASNLRAAAERVLAELADPAARIVEGAGPAADGALCPGTENPAAATVPVEEQDGVPVLRVGRLSGVAATPVATDLLDAAVAALASADRVVLDLRGTSLHVALHLPSRMAGLLGVELALPATVVPVRTSPPGAPPAELRTPGPTVNGSEAKGGPRVAVVIGAEGFGADLAAALQAVGCPLVQAGPVAPAPRPRLHVDLSADLAVELPVARLEQALPVDAVVDDEQAVAVAVRLLGGSHTDVPVRPATRKASPSGRDVGSAAAARLHSAVASWWPYHHLLDEPWDSTLPDALESCRDADGADLDLALQAMLVGTHDGHAHLSAAGVRRRVGTHRVDARIALLDGCPVVTSSGVDQLRPGDAVLGVDGVPALELLAGLRRLLPASTDHGGAWRACGHLLAGLDGSVAVVDVEDVTGSRRTVRAVRTVSGPVGPHVARPVVTQLPGATYVDLGRLAPHEVPAALRDAGRSLLLDLRGYPRSTGALVAAALATRPVPAARLRSHWPSGSVGSQDPTWHSWSTEHVLEQVLHPLGETYRGAVTLMVDEGTISQGEHTAMLVKAARPDAVVVGSVTNGTNGAVTSVQLGADRTAVFTGYDVSWLDGSPLQRHGIQPDLQVRPTRAALAAGRDEVLERALEVHA